MWDLSIVSRQTPSKFHCNSLALVIFSVAHYLGLTTIPDCEPEERDKVLTKFEGPIRRWLVDDEARPLEQVHHLFSELAAAEVDFRWLVSEGLSPLLEGTPAFWELEREEFLDRIEERKLAAVQRPAPQSPAGA